MPNPNSLKFWIVINIKVYLFIRIVFISLLSVVREGSWTFANKEWNRLSALEIDGSDLLAKNVASSLFKIFFIYCLSHCVSISNDPTKPLLALTRHVNGQEWYVYRSKNKKKKWKWKMSNQWEGFIEKLIFPIPVRRTFSTFFHSCSNKEFTGLSWWHYYQMQTSAFLR